VFRLAHLSDPHLLPAPRPRLTELLDKRGLKLIDWHRRRAPPHDMAVLAALLDDLRAQAPDHIVVTGDLVNFGFDAEYAPALAFLTGLGAAEDVSLVPGNHDCYVRPTASHAEKFWADHMCGDDGGTGFPYLRRRGRIAIVGVSSAVPTWPLAATGWIGAPQAERLTKLLAGLREDGLFRIVLVHHSPVAGSTTPLRHLADAVLFRDALARSGAELVLHGHNHRASSATIPGPLGPIPVIGAPSASATAGSKYEPASYNVVEIDGAPGAWRCAVVRRGRSDAGITETERLIIVVPPA
jgi:3',5'-cyclic AMP phosphodiesterase CpdA